MEERGSGGEVSTAEMQSASGTFYCPQLSLAI
jgi:hypothetical protein